MNGGSLQDGQPYVRWVRWHCCLLWLGVVLFLFNLLFLNGRRVGVNVTRCRGHLSCCGNKKRAGSLPPFWALSPFFVADVKSLGFLGK